MWVYVIGEHPGGPVKIGYAKSVKSRLSALQCGNYRKLYLYFEYETLEYRSVERSAHHFAGIKNEMLGEWFDISDAEAIEAIRKAIEHVKLARLAAEQELDYQRSITGKLVLVPGRER